MLQGPIGITPSICHLCSVAIRPKHSINHIIFRLIPSAVHADTDIETTLEAFSETKKKLDAGAYKVDAIPAMADKA